LLALLAALPAACAGEAGHGENELGSLSQAIECPAPPEPPTLENQAGIVPGSLMISIYDSTDLSGFVATRASLEPINFEYSCVGESSPYAGCKPVPELSDGANFSLAWQGDLDLLETGKYTFSLQGDDGARLFIDGKEIVDQGWRYPQPDAASSPRTVRLQAGRHTFALHYEQRVPYIAKLALTWSGPGFAARPLGFSSDVAERAQELASNLVAAGFDPMIPAFVAGSGKQDQVNQWLTDNSPNGAALISRFDALYTAIKAELRNNPDGRELALSIASSRWNDAVREQGLLSVVSDYTDVPVTVDGEALTFTTPYNINDAEFGEDNGPFEGKATPQEVRARMQEHIDGGLFATWLGDRAATPEALAQYARQDKNGVDCSGFTFNVTHLADGLLAGNGFIDLMRHYNSGLPTDTLVVRWLGSNALTSSCWVEGVTDPSLARPGDWLRFGPDTVKDPPPGHHIGLVTGVTVTSNQIELRIAHSNELVALNKQPSPPEPYGVRRGRILIPAATSSDLSTWVWKHEGAAATACADADTAELLLDCSQALGNDFVGIFRPRERVGDEMFP
jgi:hypothetical protein